MTDHKPFFILAINEDQTRLFRGDQDSLQPVSVENMLPNGIDEAKERSDAENNLQMRGGGNAFNTPIFREQDLGSDHKLKDLKRYFYHIDQGIQEILGDSKTPLVIAAPDYMVPIYKETSDYLSITPQHISGNFENKDLSELYDAAASIVNEN